MADNLLDNARTAQAGLPAPRTLNGLNRMYRSVMEELNRIAKEGGVFSNPIYSKLVKLKDFLFDYIGKDKNGRNFDVYSSDSYWKICNSIANGVYKKPLSTSWMYMDNGTLSPMDAVDKLSKILKLGYDLDNIEYDYKYKPENNKERSLNDFFSVIKTMNNVIEGIPTKLLKNNRFQEKSMLNRILLNGKLPLKTQIELDPLFYTDNSWRIISDYAKSLI